MTALVVDASVWVSAADPTDPSSPSSRAFLAELMTRGVSIALPGLARLEVACALARRFRDAELARDVADGMVKSPLVTVHGMGAGLIDAALSHGTRAFLRAADAVYAALARNLGGELVSWDREHIERAGAVTPETWLRRSR